MFPDARDLQTFCLDNFNHEVRKHLPANPSKIDLTNALFDYVGPARVLAVLQVEEGQRLQRHESLLRFE